MCVITSYSIHYTKLYDDIPNENLGLLRLATKENYAYHMGNHTEEWMYDEFNRLDQKDKPVITSYSIHYTKLYEI